MNEHEKLIYLAGVLDGEGCFTSTVSANGRKEKHRYAVIAVSQQDNGLLDWIKMNFGGHIHKLKNNRLNKNGIPFKDCYQWQLRGQKAKDLADSVFSYLIVKKEQVKRCIDSYCEFCSKSVA